MNGEWLKTEGPIPLLDPDCRNGSNRAQIKGGEYLLKPLGFGYIKCPTKTFEVLNNPNNRVWQAIDEEFSRCDTNSSVWAFSLLVPSKNTD